MIIVDAHQDLAWNMLSFDRDYSLSAYEIRLNERDSAIPSYNGDTLLGWSDFQRGKVAIIFATLFAAPIRARLGDWDNQFYGTPDQAYRIYQNQLDAYYRLVDEHPDKFKMVLDLDSLETVLQDWEDEDTTNHPVGLVTLMEGAEAVRDPMEIEEWRDRGVHIMGPAWNGTRFCGGTREPGPLTKEGHLLLEAMAELGFSLDLSHMDEEAVLQALDEYPGRIIASHANVKTLLPKSESNRHLSDRVIQGLIARNGIIGVVPFNRFLMEGWKPSEGRESVSLSHVAAHIDHICQISGNALHVGIGSDFDGGFGLQYTPKEIDTIADIRMLVPFLEEKGYTETDIAAVLGQNWIRFLQESLPER